MKSHILVWLWDKSDFIKSLYFIIKFFGGWDKIYFTKYNFTIKRLYKKIIYFYVIFLATKIKWYGKKWFTDKNELKKQKTIFIN